MDDPRAIVVHCDGAMNYDSAQTGGNGFIIEFPESIQQDPIQKFYRNDHQGIQRLEMISILEAIDELLVFNKQNPGVLRKAGRVLIYTDRMSVTDERLLNPYRVDNYRKNKWKTFEEKPIKDKDLISRIQKARMKLSKEVGGRVEIHYKKEKYNKVADKLSRVGRKSEIRSKKILNQKIRHVSKRKFVGNDVHYPSLKENDQLNIRLFSWENVQDQIEIVGEILDDRFKGNKINFYVDHESKKKLHRHHSYTLTVGAVYSHHIKIADLKEISETEDNEE